MCAYFNLRYVLVNVRTVRRSADEASSQCLPTAPRCFQHNYSKADKAHEERLISAGIIFTTPTHIIS